MDEDHQWPSSRVRETFIKFFSSRDHAHWPSSSVVPDDDPSFFFSIAGMNQFNPIFLGTADPGHPLGGLKRACSTQKCIRAAGKHNNLDDVGKDLHHHSFFEMLGNWSFGDYFKKKAIELAWELLTEVYKLPSNQIYITYFGGNEKYSLVADDETRDIWLKLLPPECVLPFGSKVLPAVKTGEMDGIVSCGQNWTRIDCRYLMSQLRPSRTHWSQSYDQYLGAMIRRIRHFRTIFPPLLMTAESLLHRTKTVHDYFWEMEETGPCGPCTEIHFDCIGNRDAACLVNNNDPACIEIWNIVFLQFNRESNGSLKPLPAKHVDTGMGFELLTSILQKKTSSYDTDIFLPIFDMIQQATKAPIYAGKVGNADVDKVDMAYRVVADHIRTLLFAIADGSRPGPELPDLLSGGPGTDDMFRLSDVVQTSTVI